MVKHGGTKKKKGRSDAKDKARKKDAHAVPAEIAPDADAPTLVTKAGSFDLEDPALPVWIADAALQSGGYPYDKGMKAKAYEEELVLLQIELVKLQRTVNDTGKRVVALFEGRDGAGKGGAILALRENMNPRTALSVALPKPTEVQRGEWYFQRYIEWLPTAGEIVLFDRSWYNRAGVEPVMGFCTDSECRTFLGQAPGFEKMLVDDGTVLFKFWLDIGRAMQLKRFHERRHNPLKIWKLSPIDYAALNKWDVYTQARDAMINATHTSATPWTIVLANDKRRARLAIIRHMLSSVDYRGKDKSVISKPDPAILGGPHLLKA
jgi:polyphosphate kinase 2